MSLSTESTYLSVQDLIAFRRQIVDRLIIFVPVEVLADMIALFVSEEDLLADWLRQHGPIIYFCSDYTSYDAVVFEHNGSVYSVGKGSRPNLCRVMQDYTIDLGRDVLSMHRGLQTKYSVHQPAHLRLTAPLAPRDVVCTLIRSVDGDSTLLGATGVWRIVPPNGVTKTVIVSGSGLQTFVTGYDDVELSGNSISYLCPASASPYSFAYILSTFAFPSEFERRWYALRGHVGVIRFQSDEPRRHWVDTSTGREVHKSEILKSSMANWLQPMLTFARDRGLGIKVTYEDSGYFKYTFIDDRSP
jgi:hypothetical protein